jgi:hypothetical protein
LPSSPRSPSRWWATRSALPSDRGGICTIPASPRFYTLEQANAKVPALEKRFALVEEHVGRGRDLQDQVNDLEIVWGAKLLSPDCPEREGYLRFKKELEGEEAAVDAVIKEITGEGIEIKDVYTGLVDFYAHRGGEVVYLCWRKGEERIEFWHTLQAGFAGRKPMKEF